MSYELIITEKPSSAQKIAQALADGKPVQKVSPQKVKYWLISHNKKDVIVVSAVGHLFSVAEKEKNGFTYPSYEIEWKPASEVSKGAGFTKKYATLIKKLAKDADEITIATDYDIEGETIGLTIMRYLCGREDAHRMKYSTVTAEDLMEAHNNKSEHIDWGQANAGETRHFLDWLYGINISRALMSSIKKAGSFMILSTGRVQGPSLRIIVEREREIEAFTPEDYWQLELQAKKDKTNYSAWHKNDLAKNEQDEEKRKADRIFDGERAQAIFDKCTGKPASVEKVERREQKQAPPHPFDLGSLQREAHRCFNMRPKETLDHAQNLYSNGYISYPRTSSQQLDPKLGFKKVLRGLAKQEQYKAHADQLLGKTELKPNNGKKKDPAHPAIYPTGYVPGKLKEREKKVYDLVVKRFFATFGDPAIREHMTVTIACEDERFLAKGARTVKPNWHVLYAPYVNIKEEILPALTEGETVDVKELLLHKKQTTPPKRYTQSSIITELEKRGLGTKATRADIVESLFNRGYVEGDSITATDLGLKTYDVLEKFMPNIVDDQLTRRFEEELEEITERKIKPEQVLEEAKQELTKDLDAFKEKEESVGKALLEAFQEYRDEKNTIGSCPGCKEGTLMIRFSRKNKSRFAGCDRYPDCDTTYPLPQSGMIKSAEKTCEDCQVPMVNIKMRGKGPQEVCINPDCPTRKKEMEAAREAHSEQTGKQCPKCKEGTLVLRNGVYGAFYGCSKYPKCRHTEKAKE